MRLKNEIKVKNTTQEWIASKIGVPFGTFRKWMTRKTYPNIKQGIEIARLLGISAEYLVTGTEADRDNMEQTMINEYRKLNTTDRENVLLIMRTWAGRNISDKVAE